MTPEAEPMNEQPAIPEDLSRLMELMANEYCMRHASARERLNAHVGSQSRQIQEMERGKQARLDTIRKRGLDQAAQYKQQCLRKITALENEIQVLPQRISPRKSWWLIFECDNEAYHDELKRLELDLESVRQKSSPELEEIRCGTEAALEEASRAAENELLQLKVQHDETLRAFVSDTAREILEVESAIESLKSMALDVPHCSDGTRTLDFVRTGNIRCRFAKWDRPTADYITLPWLIPVKLAKGLVVSGSEDSLPWTHSWIFGMLNAFPSGLLRLTLIDSGHLGRSFSRWLELGDSSANLLGGKIWTELREIESRLSDLKEHVVRVTQRLLRDEFADLHAYNDAHPVAPEPFHLVVIHQPVSGWRGAIPELISQLFINGPRCGVIPCLVLPPECQHLPEVLEHQAFQSLRLGPEGMLSDNLISLCREFVPVWVPDPDCGSRNPAARLRQIADESTRRSTVSVDYESLLIDAGIDRARASGRGTTEGLVIPIGRSETGAILRLELGTPAGHHHMLIGGRTSMGKSTLIHAIVTTACHMHGPDELQVCLLDYKRGTEFMPYASEALPHARVVSIESDREFGFSVLRFLDGELERRSRLLKRTGAQSLSEYRRLSGEVLPRMLLVIDEFQVLFSGKDSLADGASQMLDQLVRQGRSYGLHVILATQALNSGWSLSANTLSQISVRIALGCDDRVSRQILGEDNHAAKLLTRPGEAIYNDQNGQVLGNQRFQAVHFRREVLGEQVRNIVGKYGKAYQECTVFDGSSLPDGNSNLTMRSSIPTDSVDLMLGLSSEMGQSARIGLESRHGQNLVLFSENRDMRLRHLRSIIESLRPQAVETVLVDAATGSGAISSLLTDRGNARLMAKSSLPEWIACQRSNAAHAGTGEDQQLRRKVLILHAPQNLPELRWDPIQMIGNPSGNTVAADFEWILRYGPAIGLHCIMLTERPGSFAHSIDPRGKLVDLFDFRVATRMAEDEARKVLPDASAARLSELGAMLYIRNENACLRYRPFEWVET